MGRTPGTASGDGTKATFSCWIKPSFIPGSDTALLTIRNSSTTSMFNIGWSGGGLWVGVLDSASYAGSVSTTRVYRDQSAWMNICVTYDTTQATSTDRIKIYINGTRETALTYTTFPSEDHANGALTATSGYTQQLCSYTFGGGSYFYGYIAEAVFCEGQALAATSFGEFDSDSPTIWKPIDVSELTFGDQGFYLDFEDSDNLGDDESGNTNDFTEYNLAATDQATDTPTNNFCTWNPLKTSDASGPGDSVFSEGNTELDDGSGESAVWGTMGVSTGQWYFEYRMKHSADVNTYVGVRSFDENDQIALDPETDGYIDGFTFKFGNDGTGSGGSGTDGYVNGYQNGTRATIDSGTHIQDDQILGVNLDLDNGKVYLQINGSDIYSGNSVCDLRTGTGIFFTPFVKHTSASIDYIQLNTGGASPYTLSSAVNDGNGYGNFEYAPKSGYLALCTKNLGSDGG